MLRHREATAQRPDRFGDVSLGYLHARPQRQEIGQFAELLNVRKEKTEALGSSCLPNLPITMVATSGQLQFLENVLLSIHKESNLFERQLANRYLQPLRWLLIRIGEGQSFARQVRSPKVMNDGIA